MLIKVLWLICISHFHEELSPVSYTQVLRLSLYVYKQLGICLRMLYAERIQGFVETVMNGKGRIEFHIGIAVDDELFEKLNRRYKILIS